MFAASIIVFREALEAALLIGIIAAATRGLDGRGRWIGIGIAAGLALSLVVAGLTDVIAQWADGAGQELFNAAVLGVAVLMLAWHNIWMASHGKEMAAQAKQVAHSVVSGGAELSAIALVIALAVLREGSETALFLYGLAASDQLGAMEVLSGAGLGLLGGAAVGGALYAGLVRIPLRWLFGATSLLVLLLASGMAGQIARLLIQGDILPFSGRALWDTTALLPVNSSLGNLLHVMMGYEARPSAMQVLFYVATFCLILLGMLWSGRPPAQSRPTSHSPIQSA
ncbi:MAG: FTR1 family protein [Gallionellaceae bacterium]|nr:FTR1 family protein [Gallionellaceae bacterium]